MNVKSSRKGKDASFSFWKKKCSNLLSVPDFIVLKNFRMIINFLLKRIKLMHDLRVARFSLICVLCMFSWIIFYNVTEMYNFKRICLFSFRSCVVFFTIFWVVKINFNLTSVQNHFSIKFTYYSNAFSGMYIFFSNKMTLKNVLDD